MIKKYENYLRKIKGYTENTILVYTTEIKSFLQWYTPKEVINFSIANVTTETIENYLSYLTDIENCARTRARKISTLKNFFEWAKEKDYIKRNPVIGIEMPKLEKTLPKYLTLEECLKLLEVAKQGFNSERNYCIIVIFLNCGLRLSELCGIKLSDIKDDYSLRVVGKGNKERIVYLNRSCIRALNAYLSVRPKVDDPHLFISNRKTPLSKKGVQSMVSAKLQEAELYGYSTHKLRHTCATLMYNYGGIDILTIKEVLGHASVGTTQIYTHCNDKKVKEAIDKNPLNGIG